jgi:PAS domain S-box-containing protein
MSNPLKIMPFHHSLVERIVVEGFKKAHFGILITNTAGTIVFANPQASDILDIPTGEMVGQNMRSKLGSLLPRKAYDRGVLRKNIHGKSVGIYVFPFASRGRFSGEMVVLDEIMDQHRCNRLSFALDLDETLLSVIESFYDGILIIKDDFVMTANSSFNRITGLKEEAVVGCNVAEFDGENHICLHTIQEVVRLVKKLKKSVTSMGKLADGNEIYVTGKPVNTQDPNQRIVVSIRDITELQLLKEEVSRLMALYLSTPEDLRISRLTKGDIVAENQVMRGLIDMVARLAQVDSVILFEGESGTGKEVLARLTHRLSASRKGPFISVNCGAIPENLFESELFGYMKGAFTGAAKEGKPGLFELSNGGVIFLDEIGEMPLNCQVKLLKVIEDRQVFRVGGTQPIRLQVRIIAATNKDLHKLLKDGRFREDLFYRLYVVPIKIPPLRERREDVFPLAWHFLRRYNKKFNQTQTFSREILQIMENYEWPGNVRELQNVVERMAIMSDSEVLEPNHLPSHIYHHDGDDGSLVQVKGIMSLARAKEAVEKKLLVHALELRSTTREAAKLLGVDHSTIVRKLKKYGLH